VAQVEKDFDLCRLERETRASIAPSIDESQTNQIEILIQAYESVRLRYPTVHDPDTLITEWQYAVKKYPYWRDKTWMKPRFDTVLLRYPTVVHGTTTMSNKRVARLRLLFTIHAENEESRDLAFVQLFDNRGHDKACGMFKVAKTDKYKVVELGSIERRAHLIPCFGDVLITEMASGKSTPALDMYNKYWINNQIDIHMYNTIYTPDEAHSGQK